jgi:hypothetical protein
MDAHTNAHTHKRTQTHTHTHSWKMLCFRVMREQNRRNSSHSQFCCLYQVTSWPFERPCCVNDTSTFNLSDTTMMTHQMMTTNQRPLWWHTKWWPPIRDHCDETPNDDHQSETTMMTHQISLMDPFCFLLKPLKAKAITKYSDYITEFGWSKCYITFLDRDAGPCWLQCFPQLCQVG